MIDHRLEDLWPQLTPSAREIMIKVAELLVGGHSGTLEMHCLKGGVRVLREGGWREYRPGEDPSK